MSQPMRNKKATDVIHSDSDLAHKMEPAAQAPESGPSNDELVENTHSENGASPVLDGDLHSPERANVNAMREAIEAQAEMEVGKPISDKQEEVKSMEIDAKPGKQIIINIASNVEVKYKLKGKIGSKKFSSKAVADQFIKGAKDKFGSFFDFINDVRGDAPPNNQVLSPSESEKTKKQFYHERPEAVGQAVQCLDCGFIGVPNHHGQCAKCDSAAVTRKIYTGKDASKSAGIFDMFKSKKQPETPTILPPAEKSTGIPCRIRNHQEDGGVGQTEQGLHNERYTIVGVHYPGYIKVQGPNGEVEVIPSFALLTSKKGWDFIKQESDKLDQEHVAQCTNDDCGRCPHISGTKANQESEARGKEDQIKWMKNDEAHVRSCTKPNCDDLAHKRIHKDEVAQKFFGKDFLKLNSNERSKVYSELFYPKVKKQKKQLSSSLKTADYEGWTNWMTWHVSLLIDNTEASLSSKHRLAQNALNKHLSVTQLANQFSRLFDKQYQETKQFNEDNAADARDSRGAYERKQLEGHQPNKNYTNPEEKQQYMKDVVDDIWYGMSEGQQSDWEDPIEECNWEEIAENALENEQNEMNEEQPEQVPEMSEEDKSYLKEMNVQGSKKKAMQLDVCHDCGDDFDLDMGGRTCGQCDELICPDCSAGHNCSVKQPCSNCGQEELGAGGTCSDCQGTYCERCLENHDCEFLGDEEFRCEECSQNCPNDWKHISKGGGEFCPDCCQGDCSVPDCAAKIDQENKQGFPSGYEAFLQEQEQENRVPKFNVEDKNYLKEMNIRGSKKKKADREDYFRRNWPTNVPRECTSPTQGKSCLDNNTPIEQQCDSCACQRGISEMADKSTAQDQNMKEFMNTGSKTAGDGMVKNTKQIDKEAGESMNPLAIPGQVLKEFYPELQHETVAYPNQNNTSMGLEVPEMIGDGGHDIDALVDQSMDNLGIVEMLQLPADVGEIEEVHLADASTSPAGGMGIGRDGKSQVLEGVPLRKENDIRGPGFISEFYNQYQSGPKMGTTASELMMAKSAHWWERKTGAVDETEQFGMFLKKVCGEISASMIAAFKVTSRPLLDKVPGVGEVQLAQIEQPQGMSSFNIVNTGSRVKYLMDKLTDSELRDAINQSWSQAAVWHDGPKGGFVYEVFVRLESIDTDTMIAKYRFVCGTRE